MRRYVIAERNQHYWIGWEVGKEGRNFTGKTLAKKFGDPIIHRGRVHNYEEFQEVLNRVNQANRTKTII